MSYRKDVYKIRLQLLGGPGSLYRDPTEFIRGFRTRKVEAPEKAPELKRWVEISGKKLPLYASRYRMSANDPHDPKAEDRFVYDEFAVVPAGRRFLVLGASKISYEPDEDGPMPREWETFLKSFELAAPYD